MYLFRAERPLERMKRYPPRRNVSMSPECDSPIVYLCISHLVVRPIGFYNLGRLGTELVSLGEMLSGFSIFCYQCLTLLE